MSAAPSPAPKNFVGAGLFAVIGVLIGYFNRHSPQVVFFSVVFVAAALFVGWHGRHQARYSFETFPHYLPGEEVLFEAHGLVVAFRSAGPGRRLMLAPRSAVRVTSSRIVVGASRKVGGKDVGAYVTHVLAFDGTPLGEEEKQQLRSGFALLEIDPAKASSSDERRRPYPFAKPLPSIVLPVLRDYTLAGNCGAVTIYGEQIGELRRRLEASSAAALVARHG